MMEWFDKLINLADEWKLRATRIRGLLDKKEEWKFSDQRDFGTANQLEDSAQEVEDIAYAMKREAESIPPDPGDADILKWETEARRKILKHDTPADAMMLYARIYQLSRMVREISKTKGRYSGGSISYCPHCDKRLDLERKERKRKPGG